jgi:dihydroorotase
MKILFKNATLINEKSPFHNQKKDVLVIDGLLTQIEDQIEVEDATCYRQKRPSSFIRLV